MSELVKEFWNAQDECFFDQQIIAEVLGVSARTLEFHRLNNRGIPFFKIGRTVRYKKKDIVEWINEAKVRTTKKIGIINIELKERASS